MKFLIEALGEIILHGRINEVLDGLKKDYPNAYKELLLAVLDRMPK